jgi:hypothetical protein
MQTRSENPRRVNLTLAALAVVAGLFTASCAKGDDGTTLFDDGFIDAGGADAMLADTGTTGRKDAGILPSRDSGPTNPGADASPADAGQNPGADAGFVCNATSCASGCCAGNTCVTGVANDACGTGGAACATCPSPGQVCTAQACVVAPCGPATCPQGCCSANTCMGGALDTACGAAGAACTNCKTSNDTCKLGACVAPTCGASTCAQGCCDSSGTCRPGTADTACGKGGKACVDCSNNPIPFCYTDQTRA